MIGKRRISLVASALLMTMACESQEDMSGQVPATEAAQQALVAPHDGPSFERSTEQMDTIKPGGQSAEIRMFSGFDVHKGFNRATILNLGLDVEISHQGGIKFYHPRHFSATTLKMEPAGEPYRLGTPRIGREDGAMQSLGQAQRVETKGSRTTLGYAQGVREFYDHRDRGLEQTLVIEKPLEGERGKVVVEYTTAGHWTHRLDEEKQEVQVVAKTDPKHVLLRWQKLVVKDAFDREVPAHMEADGETLRYVVDATDITYPLTIDPIALTPSYDLPGSNPGALFGGTVRGAGDVDGDGFDDVLISEEGYTGTPDDLAEGRVLLYLGTGAGTKSTADWTVEGDNYSAVLGASIIANRDLDGDGKMDFAIGAPNWDVNDADPKFGEPGYKGAGKSDYDLEYGLVLVFFGTKFNATVMVDPIIPQLAVRYQGTKQYDGIGAALAFPGDVNCDGFQDFAIGSILYTQNAAIQAQRNQGRAQVFHGQAVTTMLGVKTAPFNDDILMPNWSYIGNFRPGVLDSGAQFGGSLGRVGNPKGILNAGVGCDGLSVGARKEDLSGVGERGRAYVFYGSATGLSTMPDWTESGATLAANFGERVDGGQDLNDDGLPDLVVSSSRWNGPVGTGQGRVLVYYGTPLGYTNIPSVTLEGPQADARFGSSVAIVEDVNDSGVADLLVGSGRYSEGGLSLRGKAFLYRGSSLGLETVPYWEAIGTEANGRFGAFVADAGDLNKDGLSDIAIGAPRERQPGVAGAPDIVNAGHVYFFSGSPNCNINGELLNDGQSPVSKPCVTCDTAMVNLRQTGVPKAMGTMCDDGSLCTTMTLCDGMGACLGQPTMAAQACPTDPLLNTECTVGVCLPDTGLCASERKPMGTACEDGNLCTSSDACDDFGQCISGTMKDCSGDADQCNTAMCEGTTGLCVKVAANEMAVCTDNDICTATAACVAGTCTRQTEVTCTDTDMNTCTEEVCVSAGDQGCTSANVPTPEMKVCQAMGGDPACTAGVCSMGGCDLVVTTGCFIANTCVAAGDTNGGNVCQVCDAANPDDFTNQPATVVCAPRGCNATNNTFQPEGLCDGVGTCAAISPVSCGFFGCDAATGCRTTCATTADCRAMGAICDTANGVCVSDGTNLAPVAIAGMDISARSGETVTLDGSASSDPNPGDTLTYQWEYLPAQGSTAMIVLTDATQPQATFVLPREAANTIYTFRLTVTDNGTPALSSSDEVDVRIGETVNGAPTAVIEGPTTANPGQQVTYSGTMSSDPDGDPLTYRWAIDPSDNVGQVGIDQDTYEVTFPATLAAPVTYTVSLRVTDSFGTESDLAELEVVVGAEVGGDMGTDMGVQTDMGTDMGVQNDMDTDMGVDMGTNRPDAGSDQSVAELQGGSCACTSVEGTPKRHNPLVWLLAMGLGAMVMVRKRRRD